MTKQNIRQTLSLAILLIATCVFQGCTSSSTTTPNTGDWVQRSSMAGSDRSNAVAFEINGLGYIGTGFDGTNRLSDFWSYDPINDNWVQLADVPGSARSEAIGFSIAGLGYIGLGYDGTNLFNDFWQFNPNTNSWAQKANFGTTVPAQSQPVLGRYGAVGFAIGNLGYVGTGYDVTTKKDFFKYDPSVDLWDTMVVYGGDKRMSAIAFVAGGKAYVGTGIYNGVYQKDFFQYDPTTYRWTRMLGLEYNGIDLKRYGAAAFSINGKGYISTGTYTSVLNNTWEYSPPVTPGGMGIWTQKGNFEGAARTGAVGLSVGNKGFVLTGKNGNNRYGDIWQLYPNATQVF